MESDPVSAPPSRWRAALAGIAPRLYVAALAFLLASFPARNLDLWSHLAAGRAAIAGNIAALNRTWLYDVACYLLYQIGGGPLLAVVKSVVVAAVGLIVLRLARLGAGLALATIATALTLLALSTRLPLQPVTVSYLLLALAMWLAVQPDRQQHAAWWPGWGLVSLFLIWTNTDRWAIVGVILVGLIWLGRYLDGITRSRARPGLAGLAILVIACAASPSHVRSLLPPEEIVSLFVRADDASPTTPTSPFGHAYLAAFRGIPAARAYYVLLALSGLSFLLARKDRRWERFLPWLALATVSAFQARAVPLFAVIAGPVLAWNVAGALARWPALQRVRRATLFTCALAVTALLICAWPGWLQGPPYGPRRWTVERPVAIEGAAAVLDRWHTQGLSPAGSRTLHTSREIAEVFAWFGPTDAGLFDGTLIAALADPRAAPPRDQLRAAGVSRAVVPLADHTHAAALLEQFLTAPDEWPLLHVAGGVAIFGWRDPARTRSEDPFATRVMNFDRLAFHPTDEEKAPLTGPPVFTAGRWWEAFWRSPPGRSPDRDEARLLLLKAEAERISAPLRHARAWEGWQAATVVGGCAAIPAPNPATLALRLTLGAPPPPNAKGEFPRITQTAFEVQRAFVTARGDVSPGLLYAAIRAGRRAVAVDPADAGAYLTLGQCYLRLLDSTSERLWAVRFPLLGQLRQSQASAALNRAVTLDPALEPAQLELALLYRRMSCGDLAVTHMRAYRDLVARARRTPDPRASDEVMEHLKQLLARHRQALDEEAARVPVAERAQMAARRGLAGEALRLLLGSDVSAFGTPGMRLELDLLLKTGRVADLLKWATPELRNPLGAETFHWLRAQAHLSRGDYIAAQEELATVAGAPLTPARAGVIVGGFAGKAVLNSNAIPVGPPALLWRALVENDFQAESLTLREAVASQCNLSATRGLLDLEAGDVDRARQEFRESLEFSSPNAQRGFSFPAQPLAFTALGWLTGGSHH